MKLNLFEMWIAVASVISSTVYFTNPEALQRASVSGQIGYGLASVWNGCYLAAGVGIIWGLLRPSPRIEVAALCVLGAVTGIDGVSILDRFDVIAVSTATTFLTLTIASWARAIVVYRSARMFAEAGRASGR